MPSEKTYTAERNRELKERLVREGRAHAALVFDGEAAVAWCEYGSCAELPNIYHRKQYDAEADLYPDYRITCLFVDKRHRRHGVSVVALHGALDLIAQAGGGVVEGYPHDTQGKKQSVLYNGTRRMFEDAGFELVRTKGQKNTVMRRTVTAAR
jgi:GNAT superfamily N-acetyltransferase